MQTFLKDCLEQLITDGQDISQSKFILPSRRACIFLKQELAKLTKSYTFSPNIISIETFIEEVSGLKSLSNTETLFYFYQVYKELTPKEKQESFEAFNTWAQILIHDFNEIDRHKVEAKGFFSNLASIKQLENWSPNQNQPSKLIKNYLYFWENSYPYYQQLKTLLIKNNIAYQGLQYREATKQIENYIQNNPEQHYFIGFNALNKCEELLINEFLLQNKGNAFWDLDLSYLNNHNASIFLKDYKNNWTIYKQQKFNFISNHFSEEKNITTHPIAKNIGQVKKVGALLSNLSATELNNTAVVLGDENLLEPLLNALPDSIKNVNITMGLPLNSVPMANFFELIFILHKNKKNDLYYFKDVLNLLANNYAQLLFSIQKATLLSNHINSNNTTYINSKEIKTIVSSNLIQLVFSTELKSFTDIDSLFKKLVNLLKEKLVLKKNDYLLDLEYTYRFNQLFNQLEVYQNKFKIIDTLQTYFNTYKTLLHSENLDLQGEPVKGLQIMGMLETRVLDFNRVIITSVNEGTLPSGKSINSFIPFDLKIAHKLPTYKEKDAVYAYHFFRLLQRAKHIDILYNTESDGLTTGEKSRFILQLEKLLQKSHQYKTINSLPKTTAILKEPITITKTKSILQQLDKFSEKGFSPSSLTQYIRNPIDFYTEKILGLYPDDLLEETVAHNTLGTIVHNSLENFYKPLINTKLSKDHITSCINKIDTEVDKQFKDLFKQGSIKHGKNFLIYHVAKRYVYNFLQFELKKLEQNQTIVIRAIENDYRVPLFIPELNKTVCLRGKIDRIDETNGVTRIIDYKTGLVTPGELSIKDWSLLKTDYKKHSKAFQVLTYAYLLYKSNKLNTNTQTGIISFKNMQSGYIPLKEDKNLEITQNTMIAFEKILQELIAEIYDLEVPFIEKEIN